MILGIFGPILVDIWPTFDIFGQKGLKHWPRKVYYDYLQVCFNVSPPPPKGDDVIYVQL